MSTKEKLVRSFMQALIGIFAAALILVAALAFFTFFLCVGLGAKHLTNPSYNLDMERFWWAFISSGTLLFIGAWVAAYIYISNESPEEQD